jgi:hypothetical protein
MTLSNGQALVGAHIPTLAPLRETAKLSPNATTLCAIRRAGISAASSSPTSRTGKDHEKCAKPEFGFR